MTMRVAILGGTFDPIHFGHLAVAEEVRWKLGLARVFFVPAAQQPLKAHTHLATAEQRLAMVRLATLDNPTFDVCDLEVRRGGRSYTIDTVQALQVDNPSAEFTFVAGADVLQDLKRWYRVEQLLELCSFTIVSRPGYRLDLEPVYAGLPGARGRIEAVVGPALEISSTDLRGRLLRGAPVRYQLPDAVIDYIEANGLYRPGA